MARLELVLDDRLDELAHPVAQAGLDRIKPVIEKWTGVSASDCREIDFVLPSVMAWSPPAANAGIVWISAPGDYASSNSNHTQDGTCVTGSSSRSSLVGRSFRKLAKNGTRKSVPPHC
jgi:hypothetical protein